MIEIKASCLVGPVPVLSQRGLIAWAAIGDILNSSKPTSRVAATIEKDAKDASPTKRLYKKIIEIPSEIKIDAVNLCVNYRIGLGVLR